jgi:hypothetical protein
VAVHSTGAVAEFRDELLIVLDVRVGDVTEARLDCPRCNNLFRSYKRLEDEDGRGGRIEFRLLKLQLKLSCFHHQFLESPPLGQGAVC